VFFTPLEPYSYGEYFMVLTGFYLSFCEKYGKITGGLNIFYQHRSFLPETDLWPDGCIIRNTSDINKLSEMPGRAMI